MEVIREDCKKEGVRLTDRLPVIVTHGLCHLIGYQHDVQRNTTLVRYYTVEPLNKDTFGSRFVLCREVVLVIFCT